MAIPLLRSRRGCALHGAIFTAEAIDGVAPLIHSTMGCGSQALQLQLAGCGADGFPAGGAVTASSNISEKQVVFGGTSRLREQLKNSFKILNKQLIILLSGCAVEMIGDDIPAMVKEARDQGEAVIPVATAGFRGSSHLGYELLLKAVLAHFDVFRQRPGDHVPGLVNILGLVPQQDAFWLADIEELSRMIAGAGFHPNPLFGPTGGIQGLRDLVRAEVSLVVSPWGLGTARELERQFGIPWLESDGLPVGADASVALLQRNRKALGKESSFGEAFLAIEVKREAYILDRAIEILFRQGPQRDFALVAGSAHATGLFHFLTGTLGWQPRAVVVTDDPPPEARAHLEATLVGAQFAEDAGLIDDIVRDSSAEIIFGSDFERSIADELAIPLIEVSFPASRRLGLVNGFGGFRGGLNLIEAITSRQIS